jgi:hypothetical protein
MHPQDKQNLADIEAMKDFQILEQVRDHYRSFAGISALCAYLVTRYDVMIEKLKSLDNIEI